MSFLRSRHLRTFTTAHRVYTISFVNIAPFVYVCAGASMFTIKRRIQRTREMESTTISPPPSPPPSLPSSSVTHLPMLPESRTSQVRIRALTFRAVRGGRRALSRARDRDARYPRAHSNSSRNTLQLYSAFAVTLFLLFARSIFRRRHRRRSSIIRTRHCAASSVASSIDADRSRASIASR